MADIHQRVILDDGTGVNPPSAALGSAANPINTSSVSIGTSNLATSQAAMTATAAVVVAARSGRRKATLYNSGANTVFVGASGVTTATGLRLLPGGSLDVESAAVVYGVCAATLTSNVDVLEVF